MSVDAASGSGGYANLIANSDAMAAASATRNANATDTSAVAKAKTKDDKDMFLKLLVAQLRYQDPSKPADTTAFMAQTAQFSALEAMQDVATQSSTMVAAQNKLQASTMVGQTVSYTAEDGTLKTGEVKSVSFTQGSVGGTNGEPVLNVDGTSVVLSKVTGIGEAAAMAAPAAAAAKAAADAKAAAAAAAAQGSPATSPTSAGSPTTSPTSAGSTSAGSTSTSPTSTSPTSTTATPPTSSPATGSTSSPTPGTTPASGSTGSTPSGSTSPTNPA